MKSDSTPWSANVSMNVHFVSAPKWTPNDSHEQGIYFKEVSEDDEDEETVINAIKLYGPKTSRAGMDFSKLEKVG